MSRGLRALVLAASVLLLLISGGVVGLFLFSNAHWVLLRIPVWRWQWERPLSFLDYEAPLAGVILASGAAGGTCLLLLLLPPSPKFQLLLFPFCEKFTNRVWSPAQLFNTPNEARGLL